MIESILEEEFKEEYIEFEDNNHLTNRFLSVLETSAQEKKEDTDLMDEIPPDYLDPILATVMTDPVLLPSGQTMDRSVIERHLLSSLTNPFTMEPMTPEDLKPNEDLREEIENWIANAKKKNKSQ